MSGNEPIFVVGVPRSGTTLLAAILGAHNRIACGPETQFFSKLDAGRLARAVTDPQWPADAVDCVCSLTLTGEQVVDLFGTSRSAVETFLRSRPPSIHSMLEALTQTHAARAGKQRWAEKTPNHLLHLPAIRAAFPHSPVLRIVRDPRDTALSMQKLPWRAGMSVVANADLWRAWHDASNTFFVDAPLTATVRYEDLVSDPEREVRRVCALIGEAFEPQMLDTRFSGRAARTDAETWKADAERPIDPGHAGEWRAGLSRKAARTIEVDCWDALAAFGYDHGARPGSAHLALAAARRFARRST